MAGKAFASTFMGLILSAALAAPGVQAQSSQAPVTDSSFVQMAASGGLAEVQLGKVAQQKGASADVKQFGQRMVTDHTKANKDVMAAAQNAGITAAPKLLPKHQATVDQLSGQSGEAFDKAYMAAMMKDHVETVALFQREAENGQSEELKQVAKQSLPVLEEHLARARQIAGKMGVDTTGAGTAQAERSE